MTCKNCLNNPVWRFTNKKQLCRNCFLDYFERKVFATIRKFNLMPKNKIFFIKKDNSVNTNVLIQVLGKRFQVQFFKRASIDTSSISNIANSIFSRILNGNFNSKLENKSPLFYLTEKEIDLYAQLNRLKGKKTKENKKIKELFSKFKAKNPDLEHNVVNAYEQLR